MENRAAHDKALANSFRSNLHVLERGEVDVEFFIVELARRLLREHHAAIRGLREK